MTEFERTLRDHMNEAWKDVRYAEDYTPAELDAYTLGAKHAIEEAVGLFDVEVALEAERRQGPTYDLGDTFGEVRTTFAIEWEQGTRVSSDLRIVDETIDRTFAVLDSMEDCE